MTDAADPTPTQPVQPEEPPVEIHKLKPIHGWRDFFKELGTIVLGIVIAIALEHSVVEWNWNREVKVARQALQAEILTNNSNLLARRVAVAPCVDHRLDTAERIIVALEAKRTPELFPDFRVPTGFLTNESEWQAERASQVLTHFPRNELSLFSRYYAQLPDFGNWIGREEKAWGELSLLQNPSQSMSEAEINRLKVSLFDARRVAGLIRRNAQRELEISKRLGVAAATIDKTQVKNFCSGMSTEEYQRWQLSQPPLDAR